MCYYVLFYIESSSNIFEFMYDPLPGLVRYLSYEVIENMDEVRFPNIYIVSHIIYYFHPLTIIIVLAAKAVGFLLCIMVISKIKHEFF